MALIIDMLMPSCCEECSFSERVPDIYRTTEDGKREPIHWIYACSISNHFDEYSEEPCPIIGEMPDEYGRLVDGDKLAKEFDGHGVYLEEEVKEIIDFYPAIVEASDVKRSTEESISQV